MRNLTTTVKGKPVEIQATAVTEVIKDYHRSYYFTQDLSIYKIMPEGHVDMVTPSPKVSGKKTMLQIRLTNLLKRR